METFAKRVGLKDRATRKHISLTFLASLARNQWRQVYEQACCKPKPAFAKAMDQLTSGTASDEQLKDSLRDIQLAHEELEQSRLPKEKDPAGFFSRYKQIAALRNAFMASARMRETAEKWSPLEATKAFLVVFSGDEYLSLWAECYRNKFSETRTILNAYRQANKLMDAREYAALLDEYVA